MIDMGAVLGGAATRKARTAMQAPEPCWPVWWSRFCYPP